MTLRDKNGQAGLVPLVIIPTNLYVTLDMNNPDMNRFR
jgi:hypothetical protein